MPIQRRDFTGLTDQYMDTAAYNLDPAFTNLFLRDPKEIDQRRFNAYRYFMDFYKGRQWEESGEFNPAFGNKSLLQEEYTRRTRNVASNIVDKLVAFCTKESWSIKLPEELENNKEGDESDPNQSNPFQQQQDLSGLADKQQPPQGPQQQGEDPNQDPFNAPKAPEIPSDNLSDRNPIHDLLEAVWTANNREQFTYNLFSMGCVTGDTFVKISYDEDFYADGIGELKFDVLDSRTVLPFFDGQDRNKMIGARIQYPTYEIQADGSKRKVMYQEVHTESTIVEVIDGEIQSVAPNPLGEMLIIHIKNEPVPWERFGRSDLEDLIMPQKEYNEKVSDFSEILAYHAAPITIVKGARIQSLEKGARKIWGGIPKDGSVENLNLETDFTGTLEFLDRLKKHLHETGEVPEEAMGALQEVSNTSGSALHLQYQPILDRVARKQINYEIGLKEINRIILRFYEAVGALDLPEDVAPALKYKTSIEWGDPLPRDRSIDLADISTEMGLGIESKRGALKRLGEENPEAKLEEVQQETVEQAQMDFVAGGIGGFGDPNAGPDGMGGAASGADDGTQNDVSGAVSAAKTNPATQGNQTSVQAVKKSAQTTTNQNKVR